MIELANFKQNHGEMAAENRCSLDEFMQNYFLHYSGVNCEICDAAVPHKTVHPPFVTTFTQVLARHDFLKGSLNYSLNYQFSPQ